MDDLTVSGDLLTVEKDVTAITAQQQKHMRDHHGRLFAYLYIIDIQPVYQGREKAHDAYLKPVLSEAKNAKFKHE